MSFVRMLAFYVSGVVGKNQPAAAAGRKNEKKILPVSVLT